MEWRGSRVLVTGSSGFLGKHLCKRLVSSGARVIGVSRNPYVSNEPAPLFQSVSSDLSRPETSRALVSQFSPDVVFHLAGNVSAAKNKDLLIPMFQDNVAPTVYLLDALAHSQCRRVITIGSIEELGPGGVPDSPYGIAKLAAQQYGSFLRQRHGLPLVQIRLNLAYGPGQNKTKFVPYVISKYLGGEIPELRSPERICDFVYVDDVVSALLSACESTPDDGQILEIGSGTSDSLFNVAERIRQLLGSEPAATKVEYRPANEPKRVAQKNWGWCSQTSMDEGLKRTIKWYEVQQAQVG